MRSVVNLREMLKIQVSIYLSRADVGVPEELLHPAQVAARFEQMAREGVAKHVRVHVHCEALASRPQIDPQLHRARTQPAPGTADEHRLSAGGPAMRSGARSAGRAVGCAANPGRALSEPCAQRIDGESADGHDPRFSA